MAGESGVAGERTTYYSYRPTHHSMGAVVEPVELPCGHTYCKGCLDELRAKGVQLSCPQCRADLPPGLDGLYDLVRSSRRAVYRRRGADALTTRPPPPPLRPFVAIPVLARWPFVGR